MVGALMSFWALVYVTVFEIAGAAAVAYGLYLLAGPGAAWIAVGIALFGKSLELDLNRRAVRQDDVNR